MATTDFSRFFSQDMSGHFPAMNGFGFDFHSILEAQRKNIEAFSEAQQMALEGLQAAAQRHGEILTRLVQDNSSLAKEIMSESMPEQKVARQADLMKKNYESSISGFRELSDMLNKSSQEAADILNKRISASFTEMKTVLEKTGKAASAVRQKAAA